MRKAQADIEQVFDPAGVRHAFLRYLDEEKR